MLVKHIEWIGERIHIQFHDLETVVLMPAEALDILGWLMQEQEKILQLNAQSIEELRRKDL